MTVVDIADQVSPYVVLANRFAAYNHFLMTLGVWTVNPAGFLSTSFVQSRTIVHELGHNLWSSSLRYDANRICIRGDASNLLKSDELRSSNPNGNRSEQLSAPPVRRAGPDVRRLVQST